jgi:O-antigen/teichoic acid export membrane protein
MKQIKNLFLNNLILFSILSLIGQGIGTLLPLFIAKIFTPESFGVFSLSLLITFFFLALLINPTQTPFIIASLKEKGESGKINKSLSVQLLFFTSSIVIFLILFLMFKNQIVIFVNIDLHSIKYIYLGLIGLAIKSNLVSLFLALDQKKISAAIELIFNLIILCFVIFFQMTNLLSISTIFTSYFFSSLLILIISSFFIKKEEIFPFCFDFKIFKYMLHFSQWQIIGLSSAYLINWGDNFLLRIFSSLKEIGVYNLAYQIFKAFITATYVINSYFIGFITLNIGKPTEIKKYLGLVRNKILIFGCVVVALSLVLVPWIINFIYGEEYKESIAIINILLIGFIFALHNIFYIPLLNTLKKYKFIQTAFLLQICVNLGLNLILIPQFGIKGAAISTLIGYIFICILYECYFQKRIKKLVYNLPPFS